MKKLYYNIKWFFKNLWRFRKTLWEFRDWDHSYCVELYAAGLEQLANCLEHGNEDRFSANKKVKAIHTLIEYLSYYDDVEEFYKINWKGYTTREESIKYQKMVKDAYKHYNQHVFKLLAGQDPDIVSKQVNELEKSLKDPETAKKFCVKYGLNSLKDDLSDYYTYVEIFDGSGCREWWD